jgi:putative membrane protein
VPHPEVWLLVGGLVGLYTWAARVIGPKVVPAGTPAVTARQRTCFVAGILLLWVATDWPVHDIGEQYLYLVHMCQHLVLTLVMPPLLLLATPEWLARLVLGKGRVDRWVHTLARPVPALVLFNGLALLTHWQVIVNTSSENGLFHYGMHTAIVTTAFLLWIPICGPLPELRIAMPTQMLYLFVTSIVPTVPGAWLTFAEGAVYRVYDIPQRLGGISVTSDQQVAGLIMKLVGGTYLWVLIACIFFRWANRHHEANLRGESPSEREVLTWDTVERELAATPAVPDPHTSH